MRVSIPRQLDKKSGALKEEKGIWGSQGGDRGLDSQGERKDKCFFPTFLSKDYITIMCPT